MRLATAHPPAEDHPWLNAERMHHNRPTVPLYFRRGNAPVFEPAHWCYLHVPERFRHPKRPPTRCSLETDLP